MKKGLSRKIVLIISSLTIIISIIIYGILTLTYHSDNLVISSQELVQTKSEKDMFNAQVENKTDRDLRDVEVTVKLLNKNNEVFDEVSISKNILSSNEVWSFSIPISKEAASFEAEVYSPDNTRSIGGLKF